MREICMLRARWRGLETEPRTSLHGHEGGNPGHSQGMPYGPPRQSSTLPAVLNDMDPAQSQYKTYYDYSYYVERRKGTIAEEEKLGDREDGEKPVVAEI